MNYCQRRIRPKWHIASSDCHIYQSSQYTLISSSQELITIHQFLPVMWDRIYTKFLYDIAYIEDNPLVPFLTPRHNCDVKKDTNNR
jgi:hypothetical protein